MAIKPSEDPLKRRWQDILQKSIISLFLMPILALPSIAIKNAPEGQNEAINAIQEVEAVSLRYPYEFIRALECESGNEHRDRSGNIKIHYNKNGSYDIGIGQVNSVHIPKAKTMGLDLMNEKDNLEMAYFIYTKQGIGAFYGYDSHKDACTWYENDGVITSEADEEF